MHWREHQQRIRRSSTSLLIFAILSMNHTVWGINSAQFGLVWRRFVVICVFSSYRGHNLGWTFELLWARDYILTALAKSLWADAWASLKSLFGVRNVLSDWKFWKILVFGSKFGLRMANMFANTKDSSVDPGRPRLGPGMTLTSLGAIRFFWCCETKKTFDSSPPGVQVLDSFKNDP